MSWGPRTREEKLELLESLGVAIGGLENHSDRQLDGLCAQALDGLGHEKLQLLWPPKQRKAAPLRAATSAKRKEGGASLAKIPWAERLKLARNERNKKTRY